MRPRSRALAAAAILSATSAVALSPGCRAAEAAPSSKQAVAPVPPVQPVPPVPPAPPVPSIATASPTHAGLLSIGSNCLNNLSIIGGATARIVSGPGNLSSDGSHITFRASGHDCDDENESVLMLPAGTGIEIRNLGDDDTTYSIADIRGSLDAATGSGGLTVDEAATLTLKMVGSGDVQVGRVTGRLAVQNISSGDLRLDTVDTSETTLTTMSSGDITISGGTTTVLTARDYSTGDITLKGAIRDADVSVLGSGDVRLDKVSQSLTRRVLGSGSLSVADTAGAKITAISTPDSDAIVSDVTKNLLEQFHIDRIFQQDGTQTRTHHHSAHVSANGGGSGLIGVFLKIALIVWAIRLYRRYRRTGVVPFHDTAERLARGYAAGVRGWERHRSAWQGSPVAGAGTVARDAWEGFRHAPTPQTHANPSVPPGHPLARLQDRLARLEPRIGRLERFVTSSDFGLERQFRDLERTQGTGR